MEQTTTPKSNFIEDRQSAIEFPLMIVFSIIYPCNYGCPECPYHDENSDLRKFYKKNKAELFPQELWNKIADEAGPYNSFLRCTGGGEPFIHPTMVDMVEYAKQKGARIWINTNGSKFGPDDKGRERLRRVIEAGTEIIEFSMDAGDAETYAKLRPPISGPPKDPQKWFDEKVSNIKAALELRKELKKPTRIVVSMIRQKEVMERMDSYISFYRDEIGVDEVITRKFLNWDDNTNIDLATSMDPNLYEDSPKEGKEPCVWPFERLNVDTMGRIALCGQDISFRTSENFPNANDHSIKSIWQGEMFNWYRKKHLDGEGSNCNPCRGCSAWLAGIRDSKYGWLQVLKKSGDRLKEVMAQDIGSEVEIYEPKL